MEIMKKLFFLLPLLLLLASGCSVIKLESCRKVENLAIDGKDDEWTDAKYYIADENIVVGAMNDEEYLYLCFYPTTSELSRRILSSGCTVWFDAKGGHKKALGLHFPLGMQPDLKKGFTDFEKPEKGNFSENDQPSDHPKMMGQMIHAIPQEVEIIRPSVPHKKVKLDELNGLEIAIESCRDIFACEYKIPLKNDDTFAIGAEPGKEISICFETPETESGIPSPMGRPGGGGRGSEIPGGRDGGPENDAPGDMTQGGGDQPDSGSSTSKRLKMWVKVQLL